MSQKNKLLVLTVLLVFSVFTVARHLDAPGDDLSSSYYGCRLIAAGQAAHLYSQDPGDFDHVADPVWMRLAQAEGPAGEAEGLHPYVQVPLWAYSLLPLCTRTQFRTFNAIFTIIETLCFAGTIWLVSLYWAPRTMHPGWIALLCIELYTWEPYKYAMHLTQTHILYIFLTIAALICARRQHGLAGGMLLALAAAVKITPALLLIYWLVTKQRRAALSFIASMLVLGALTVLTSGWVLTLEYLRNLGKVSNMLLVSWNNESFAALWMAHKFSVGELYAWHPHPLPTVVKATCTALSVAATGLGGFLDRRSAMLKQNLPPYGAVFAMVGATMFAPLAWTHYYVVLIIPVVMMLDALLQRRSLLVIALFLLVFTLNLDTGMAGGILMRFRLLSFQRSELVAGLLAMIALVYMQLRKMPDRREPADENV